MSEPRKFRAPDGETIVLNDINGGHTAVLTDQWRELPERFHREAISNGAEISDQTIANRTVEKAPEFDEQEATVEKALKEMIERDDDQDFTGAGMPNIAIVRGLAGFNAPRELIFVVFERLKKQANDERPDTKTKPEKPEKHEKPEKPEKAPKAKPDTKAKGRPEGDAESGAK